MEKKIVDIKPLVEFIEKIGGNAVAEGAGILADWAAMYRQKNLLSIKKKWEEICNENNISDPKSVAPRILIPLLEAASVEDNITLQDMWANLIASGTSGNEIHPAFVEVTKQLCVEEAEIVVALSEIAKCDEEKFPIIHMTSHLDEMDEFVENEFRKLGVIGGDRIESYMQNLKRTGILTIHVYGGGNLRKLTFDDLKIPTKMRSEKIVERWGDFVEYDYKESKSFMLTFSEFGTRYLEACGLTLGEITTMQTDSSQDE